MKINWQNVAEQALGTILATALLGIAGWILFPDSIPVAVQPVGWIAIMLGIVVIMWLFFRKWLQRLGAAAGRAISWWARQWRYNLAVLLLILLEATLYWAFKSTLIVFISLGHIVGFALVLVLFFRKTIRRSHFEYTAGTVLDKWKASSGWTPIREGDRIQLLPHEELTRVLICKDTLGFINGAISFEVYLDPDALFDVFFRGDLQRGEFYMARFDARPRNRDCILYKSKGAGWREVNSNPQVRYTSPNNQWLVMRVVIQEKSIMLYRDRQLVDQVDSASSVPGQVGIFAEVANVYIRKISISL